MKKTFLSLLALTLSVALHADLFEDFNSLTSGTWNTATDVDLPSGHGLLAVVPSATVPIVLSASSSMPMARI